MSKATGDKLATQFAAIADDLLRIGISPGVVTYALTVAAAMVFKVYGSGDLAAVKALVCETIDQTWRADDVAEEVRNQTAVSHRKHAGN